MNIVQKLQLNTFVISLLFSLPAFGQVDSTKTLLLKLYPLEVLNIFSPAIQIGLEKPTNNWHSFIYTIGYSPVYITNSNHPPKSFGFKTKFQTRRYKNSVLEGKYFAIEAFNNFLSYLRKDTFGNGLMGCQEIFRINKWVTGFNFKRGRQRFVDSKIADEFFWGLGIRFRKVWYSEKECPTNVLSSSHCITCGMHVKGVSLMPRLSIGYNFGIKLTRGEKD